MQNPTILLIRKTEFTRKNKYIFADIKIKNNDIEFIEKEEALNEVLENHWTSEIFNTDQWSQFTGTEFTSILELNNICISMDSTWRYATTYLLKDYREQLNKKKYIWENIIFQLKRWYLSENIWYSTIKKTSIYL